MKKLILGIFTLAIAMMSSSPAAVAGDINVKGGLMYSFLNIPMMGFTVMTGYQTDIPILADAIQKYLKLDLALEQETTVYIHKLAGSATKSHNLESGTVQVEWESIEIDYFLLADIGSGWKLGPGIGYGIGTSKETAASSGFSSFLNEGDIHYGVLLLKAQKSFGDVDCELNFSSFGGLISGGALCGITF